MLTKERRQTIKDLHRCKKSNRGVPRLLKVSRNTGKIILWNKGWIYYPNKKK